LTVHGQRESMVMTRPINMKPSFRHLDSMSISSNDENLGERIEM
jgi:hypothetical protein